MKLSSVQLETSLLVNYVGNYIREERRSFHRSRAENKALNDLVSYVDKTAEEKLLEGCLKILPGSSFLAEEHGAEKRESEFTWIIDPLDGTTNFIHGIPHYCISVALQRDGETIMGWVYEVNADEMFHAVKGIGASLNDQPIQVSETADVHASLIATGFPVNKFQRLPEYLQLLEQFIRNSHGVRRLGTAALDLCYVACGRVEGYYEYGLNPWDVAACALIVEEAGGKVTDFAGKENYIYGQEIVASNSYIHPMMLKYIKACM
jgi:myo-inositol-1(or 4)-monophosphatase